jgi:uncharacterized protein (TIGR02145 family)
MITSRTTPELIAELMNYSKTAQKLRKVAAFRIALLSMSFCLSTQIAIAQTYPVVFDSTCYEFAGLPVVVDSLSCQLFAVSLELFESSETYTLRWKAGGCTTFSQSGFKINNTYVLESDSTSGFHLGMDYGQIYTWDEWQALPGAQGYRQDCSVDGNPHESWGYTLLETGEMHGFGEFEGWVLELSHQPANGYYGGQIGVSASVFPGELGFTSWFSFYGAQGDTEFLGSATIESSLFPVNLGCMYTNASNYDVAATVDDGSCTYPGCTDPSAANFSSLATEDDGSCVTCSDLAVCPEDITGDGVVSILDLLSVLAEFGSEMEETISGCTDPEAINYNPDANVDDGTCTFGPPAFDCGMESVTFDGYEYSTVQIGSQCWFAENLRTTTYANGDSIPANLSNADWSSITSGATAVYGEETASCEDNCDTVLNLEEFGRLYNWYAVNDSRNLCPNGWHVPTDGEWMTLEIELGMDPTQANAIDERGAPVGKMLKASSNGVFAWDGYDDADSLYSGFSALPGGFRSSYGDFNQLGSSAYFWTSTPDESFTFALSATPNGIGTPYMDSSPNYSIAWNRGLTSADDNVYRNSDYDNEQGFSVRCLKNGPPLVSTSFMTSDTTQNVTLVGEVVESGGDSILSTGFIWGMSPELNASDFLIGSSVHMGGFEANLTGLEPGVDYYFSAFATSASGTSYGDTVAFKVMNCSPVDFGGHTYSVLQIGGQCWFKENLRTAVYANGDSIPANLDADSWSLTPHGATSVYGESGSSCTQGCDESANLEAYGRLYNWPAVDDVRGLCPISWHVPTDEEWITLEIELELTSELANNLGWRGNSVGNQLKSSPQYDVPWDGFDSTNPLSTGFSVLPGGYRGYNGWFFNGGYWASFWSASELEGEAWIRDFFSGASGVYRDRTELGGGRYVRCLQDDEVLGCTDPAADNFDSAANTDDGTCDLTTCQGNSTVNYGGHDYDLVAIGTQCWFAENLRTTSYVNGDTISANLSDSQWSTTSSGATAIYGEGSSEVYDGSDDEVSNLEAYGRLYNAYAVTDSRGLCPNGWHIPTDGEWMMLEMELGMSTAEANSTGWRGTNQAKRLKVSPQNNPSWNGYNTFDSLQSGFSAVPSGFRFEGGLFTSMGSLSIFWSSSMDGGNPWLRTVASSTDAVERFSGSEYNQHGFPVRCVLDFESAVEGCMDPGYFEYNPDANTYDGSCSTLIVQGCTDLAADNFNSSANSDDGSCDFEVCGGSDPVYSDGVYYDLVAIGTQCWFAENLSARYYANGDLIPTYLSSAEWTSTSSGAQSIYLIGWTTVLGYGRLYNWYAVNDSRGLCPSGWHVPTDADWTTLELELGMPSSEVNSTGWRGTDQGDQLKSAAANLFSWDGSNTSGFSALPGGHRGSGSGGYFELQNYGYWWSSTPGGPAGAWGRQLGTGMNGIIRDGYHRRNGFSVRCLKNE